MTYVRRPGWRDWQPVTNEAFPPAAWRIPRAAEPIPVRARIVWREDGECWVDAYATRWTSSSVQVEFGTAGSGP